MKPFDIAPFALPNCAAGELWFEEPRDICRVLVTFSGRGPRRVGLSYLRRLWPESRDELAGDLDLRRPAAFGWRGIDDWFNSQWQKAGVRVRRTGPRRAEITFRALRGELPEFPGCEEYDVEFRRTLGIRVDAPGARIRKICAYTVSAPARTRLRVELDAGRRTPGKRITLSGYNARIERVDAGPGVRVEGRKLALRSARRRQFHVTVSHMQPAHRYCYDDGHVTFAMDRDTFTISLSSLEREGPVWFAEQGVYVARAEDETSYADYRSRVKGCRTVAQQVLGRPEQSFGGAYHGQPRPHATSYSVGCKHTRQTFWIEANGDLVLHRDPLRMVRGKDTKRFKNNGNGRFFFGLERWCVCGRFSDPAPVLAYNILRKRGDVLLEQVVFAVPLERSILDAELAPDDTIVAMVRFRFRNTGEQPAAVELPIGYSSDSGRCANRLSAPAGQDDNLVPLSKREELAARDGLVTGARQGEQVLRCAWESTMQPVRKGKGVALAQELAPGAACEAVLKVPYVALDSEAEVAALRELDFERCWEQVRAFWRAEGRSAARVQTPEPNLDAAYAQHLSAVMITDPAMPDDPELIQTSVGTTTYGNYCNESCMIIEELDQRGLHEEARRRLDVWVRYQGTARLLGNFTDYDGLYFGAGGFESGASYSQHHGWVLWCLAEHYFVSGDEEWLRGVAESLVKGLDWVFRQRRNTMGELPHSRGWERGFLPAAALEDVADFHYWLSTNCLTWRGTHAASRALEAIGHPQAARMRRESEAFRRDLIRGFETARQHSPLVRLRDGRWVPHYPSRLYRRGRDYGWIREVLEGSVYLLISGLYEPGSRQAGWILDDFQDNRYMTPPWGYYIHDPEIEWYDRGGFSVQPNLLAGLLPYLDRDEPELYVWMFFNAWCACYREEINAMVEHPLPVLGFSNSVHFKTSDQANAMKWLVYMYVYTIGDALHLGRAIPREWLRDGNTLSAQGVATRFGTVAVTYRSKAAAGSISAELALELRREPETILVRFRHPEARPIRSVSVNGRAHKRFDARRGDVDISGLHGRLTVVANY